MTSHEEIDKDVSETTSGTGQLQPHARPDADEATWYLNEVAMILRKEPAPLCTELLRVVLRGVAELCVLLGERGPEAGVQPPTLFQGHPVVAEALQMWDARIRSATTKRDHQATAGVHEARPL